MKTRTFMLAGAVLSLLAVAPAAHADAIPFDVHYQLGGQSLEAGVTHPVDTGLVGVCGGREPLCWGVRFAGSTSNVTGGTDSGTLTLRGYVCVRDSTLECSVNGIPFTGVRLTELLVDGPGGNLDAFPVDGELCAWLGSSPETPDWCLPLAKLAAEIRWDGPAGPPAGDPSDVGLSF